MEQKRIMELLVEASDIGQQKSHMEASERGQGYDRLVEIMDELKAAFPRELAVGASGTELVYGLFQTLFFETGRCRPEHLPQLFPFFAALCGDGNLYLGSATVPIDWSLLPK